MSMTTTAIAGAPEQPLSTWSGDDMGATGAYGDLIRDIAQDYFTAQEKRRDHLSGQGEQAPWRDGLEDQQATMADQTRTTFAALWPRRPRPRIQEASLTPRQEWEGYVVEVNETTFTARLVDLTAGREQEEEEADIPVAELSSAPGRGAGGRIACHPRPIRSRSPCSAQGYSDLRFFNSVGQPLPWSLFSFPFPPPAKTGGIGFSPPWLRRY